MSTQTDEARAADTARASDQQRADTIRITPAGYLVKRMADGSLYRVPQPEDDEERLYCRWE